MPQIKCPNVVIISALACLLGTAPASSAGPAAKATKKNPAVTEWFKKYDQIRRAAEETSKDKYQSLFLGENKPDKNNAALASRMIGKYTVALTDMKRLTPVPETRELQNGYIGYFGSARLLFTDFLKAQKTVPYSTKPLVPSKRRLEVMDKTNKRLDAELRKVFGIPKHKHI